MIVECPAVLPKRNLCKKVIFETTEQFSGGVIIRCRKCGSYLQVNSPTSIFILKNYAPENEIVFNICDQSVPAAASVQPEDKG